MLIYTVIHLSQVSFCLLYILIVIEMSTASFSIVIRRIRCFSFYSYVKMIAKQTGVNFINVLRTAVTHVDPECAKKTVKSVVSFGTFGTYESKSCTKNICEITPGVNFINILLEPFLYDSVL